jgi:putative ABC transport system permease protein
MIKNCFRMIVWKYKVFNITSYLNFLGLIFAFSSAILIMMYVYTEYHFDYFHSKADEIYRLEMKNPSDEKYSLFMLGPTGQTLVEEFPEVQNSTTYLPWGKWGEEPFYYENGGIKQSSYEDYAYADENITEVFSFNFISGQNKPLSNPETAIICESFAKKVWGNDDPNGKTLKVLGETYVVTGVYKDMPQNSIFKCPIILKIPSNGFIGKARKGWSVTNYPQYILLKSGTDINELIKRINDNSNIRDKYKLFDGGTTSAHINLRALKELRFSKDVAETPMFDSNNRLLVDSLFIIGILIVLVALINYFNYSIANLHKYLVLYSIKSILGSSKLNFIFQMIINTILVFLSTFSLSIIFAYVLNNMLSQRIFGYALIFRDTKIILLWLFIIILFLALFTRIYPILINISQNFSPKTIFSKSKLTYRFRGGLIIFQFAATIILISLSVGIIKQLNYIKNANLGFKLEDVLVIPMNKDLRNNYTKFYNKLISMPFVQHVGCSRAVPGMAQEANIFNIDGKSCFTWNWAVDENYMDMMGFEIVKGRGFIKESEADRGNFICNETAAKRYNWTIGTKINNGIVVGIMKDFNMVSLREKVEPFVFHRARSLNELSAVSIKLHSMVSNRALDEIEAAFNSILPDTPFKSYFLDSRLNTLYEGEGRQLGLIIYFGFLSVILSLIGIMGLSILKCQQKTKEIGIRKVNGAKIWEVLVMLNNEFIKWVVIAFVIASPIAWYAMNKWLQNFAYRTELSWWIFALAGLLALGIALLTVSFQSWKAARRNPVEALRSE